MRNPTRTTRMTWIDSAPLVASPQATGILVQVEVIRDETPPHGDLYVCSRQGPPLYVRRSWERPGGPKHGTHSTT